MIDLQLKFLKEIQADVETVSFDGHLRKLTKVEQERYSQIEADLQLLYDESRKELFLEQSPLVHPMDIYMVCGHRGKEAQTQAVAGGFSKVFWPKGKHNKLPSLAFDFCPMVWNGSKYEVDWNDIKKFKYIVNVIMRVAKRLESEGKIKKIRFGADFNQDGNLTNDKFVDLPHCEIAQT